MQAEQIGIIASGCVLPQANNRAQFWENLIACRCSIRPLPIDRWNSKFYYSSEHTLNKTTSFMGAFIEHNVIRSLEQKFPSAKNRTQLVALEAFGQVLNSVTSSLKNKRLAFLLGAMSLDESIKYSLLRDLTQICQALPHKKELIDKILQEYFLAQEHYQDALYISTVIAQIKTHYQLSGEGAIVDAACASSLAALHIACNKLKHEEVDLVFAGGIEANLSPVSYATFAALNALSPSVCLPFDSTSAGISRGEGAVIFALKRLGDAIKDGDQILGVIKGIGHSCDGRHSSLFSPTIDGQLLAYKSAYSDIDPAQIDYLEAHGTGTRVGDTTEWQSINSFWQHQTFPIGSVKALLGHTQGAAGACGVLKCLLAIQEKTIPPSPRYITQDIPGIFVNNRPLKITSKQTITMGISSFGFGGTNYHLCLQEYIPQKISKNYYSKKKLAIISQITLPGDTSLFTQNIPPKSLEHIDPLQLQALNAVHLLLQNFPLTPHNKERIGVISGSITGLAHNIRSDIKTRYLELTALLGPLDLQDKYPSINEDTGPGILNNVISGRICNAFDFRGINYNIDAAHNSPWSALKCALLELQHNLDLAIVIGIESLQDQGGHELVCQQLTLWLLSTLPYAQNNALPIKEIIEEVDYE